MKPAGPERDREIAEIRGDSYKSKVCAIGPNNLDECPDYVGTVAECPLCPDNCEHNVPSYSAKPYSTDISAAMELARIMHVSGQKDADRLLHDAWNYWMAGDDSSLEAYADAISGAYLKWKEQT